jgi:hypothetical protein
MNTTNLKVEAMPAMSKERVMIGEKLTHKELVKSSVFLDLSDSLLNKLDIYLSNTDLSDKQQIQLIRMIEEVYSEAYVNAITD